MSVGSTMLLNLRLCQLGLRPVDVGDRGDCFFRAVSHPSHHLFIRQVGVQYLSNNPERFIVSNTENSWNECINNMSMQGTCCNALFVQAVADCQNTAIHIIESHENLAGGNFDRATSFSTTSINNNIFRSFGWITLCINSSCDMWFWCIRKSTQFFLNNHRTAVQKRKRDSYRKRVKTSEKS